MKLYIEQKRVCVFCEYIYIPNRRGGEGGGEEREFNEWDKRIRIYIYIDEQQHIARK